MNTLTHSAPEAQAAVSGSAKKADLAPKDGAAVATGRKSLAEMSESEIIEVVAQVQEEKRNVVEYLGAYEKAGLTELERRIRERREKNPAARAIPHPAFDVELVDEFTPYRANIAVLREAAASGMLAEDEVAKLYRHVPESVSVVAAHDEPGNVTSILALAKKYAGTPVGDTLSSAITRTRTGEKQVFRPRKVAGK